MTPESKPQHRIKADESWPGCFQVPNLIKGLEEICNQHDMKYGNLISIIGSLTEASIVFAVPDETGKIGIRYCDPARLTGPLELLSCQGSIGRTVDDEVGIHLHGLMSDPSMTVYGGHFLDEGNPILATAEILIQECSDVQILRLQDEETGFALFTFHPEGDKAH